MLADDLKKRVVIVDTSNEIGGDGDIPHSGIGSARRMQVSDPEVQHKVSRHGMSESWPERRIEIAGRVRHACQHACFRTGSAAQGAAIGLA